MAELFYKRILLKLSGEALMGDQKFGMEKGACEKIATAIRDVSAKGVQIGIVIGGGNIFRGNQAKDFGFARTPADQIGMLATVLNGLVLQQALRNLNCPSNVLSAIPCNGIVEPFHWQKAMDYLDKNIITIFVGGTGSPYFTTDTAGALRASEIEAQALLKATKVDGVYDKDPKKYPDAKKLKKLTYSDALTKQLNVMDATSIAICRENHIPICVFDLFEEGSLLKAVSGQEIGSLVSGD